MEDNQIYGLHCEKDILDHFCPMNYHDPSLTFLSFCFWY